MFCFSLYRLVFLLFFFSVYYMQFNKNPDAFCASGFIFYKYYITSGGSSKPTSIVVMKPAA